MYKTIALIDALEKFFKDQEPGGLDWVTAKYEFEEELVRAWPAISASLKAGKKRDECKINVINKLQERIAELEKKLRDEYGDYPAGV